MKPTKITRKKQDITPKDIIHDHLADIVTDCTGMSEDDFLGEHVMNISSKCAMGGDSNIKYRLKLILERVEEEKEKCEDSQS